MERVSEKDLAYRGGDSGVKYLGRGPRIDWGVILLLPGQSLGGHYHETVEETFYVVQGRGTMVANGERIALQEGDVLRMDPTDRHDILNDAEAPLKLVFIKCPYAPKDKVDL
ncbi:MAG: cupin domain-containing protein [Anaerolineae bacterium]